MKKIKKLLPVLLMSIMSVSAFAEDAVIDGIRYSLNDETSEAEVISNYDNPYSGDITIPETVDYNDKTYSVTSIGDCAFEQCDGLTSVVIGNNVTHINIWAFYYCKGLKSVTIGNSVTSIGMGAFNGCTGLTSVTIGNSVTSIGESAFNGCTGLTSVTIGNSVTSIGENAFYECSGLTEITIPNSVTSIGDFAFTVCTGLTSVTIGNSVTSIGKAAFSDCSGLTSVTIGNSVTSIGESAFSECSGLTEITIPNSVTSIGDFAFTVCTGLTSVTIGNSVTSIGNAAFSECSGLTSVTIPNSVTSIGKSAFLACSVLESIIVEEGNTIYDSRENCNAIIETATNTLIAGCKNTVIPNSVTSIGMGAFSVCTGLTEITIPNSVTSIGDYAFYECTGLTSVISLIEEPFEINENTFYNSVEDHFEFTTATLYVPTGTKAKYESTPAWNRFENIVELSELIDGIKYSFNKETLEAEVVENTYFQYSGDITIPEKVNYKGNTYCVTSIGDYAFYACTGLTSVTIGNSVTSIGEYAFLVCGGLTSVTIGNSVTSIGDNAFLLCEGLTSVTIPNSVTSIGYNAFSGCSALESIIVEEGNTIYDSRENCNAIIETETNTLIAGCKNTVIPNSVTSIGERAFLRCSGLTSITIPNSVTSISDYAFYDCTGLTSVISLIEEPFEINENTFYNSVEDHEEFTTATLYVPAGTKSKYESTPAWNKFKMIVEQEVNAVESVETDAKAEETERYNVSGQRISSPQKGLNMVRMSDGTTRKVMCK